MTITYRADLFAQAGVDLAAATTWSAFQEACLRFQEYWAEHGYPHRHAIELSHASSDDLEMLLLQRHVNLVDADGQPRLTDPLVLQTLRFYTQLIAGRRQIGANPAGSGAVGGRLGRGKCLRNDHAGLESAGTPALCPVAGGQIADDAAATLRPRRCADQHLGRHDDRHPGALPADRIAPPGG